MYVRAAGESLQVQNAAADIKLRAERKIGEMLSPMEKNKGGRPSETGDTMSPVLLDDLGISKNQSSRWQLSSKVSESELGATWGALGQALNAIARFGSSIIANH